MNTVPRELLDEENLPPPVAWEDSISSDNFVDIDENIGNCGELSDTHILSEFLNNKNIAAEDDEDVEGEVEEQKPISTSIEVVCHLAEYRRYVEQTNVNETAFQAADTLEDFV